MFSVFILFSALKDTLPLSSICCFKVSYKSDKPSPCSAENGIIVSKPKELLSVKPTRPFDPSHLFTKTKVGLFVLIKYLENVFSVGKTPTLPSITKIIKSASLTAISVCSFISLSVSPFKESSIPAVSTSMNSRSRKDTCPYFLSLVTPGWSLTIAFPGPTKRLNKVDFPTFGLPTNTI